MNGTECNLEATVRLSGDLTITKAAGIRRSLLAALEGSGGVTVTFDGVREADLSLIQLLCSSHHSASRKDLSFTLPGSMPAAVRKLGEGIAHPSQAWCTDGCPLRATGPPGKE